MNHCLVVSAKTDGDYQYWLKRGFWDILKVANTLAAAALLNANTLVSLDNFLLNFPIFCKSVSLTGVNFLFSRSANASLIESSLASSCSSSLSSIPMSGIAL